MRLSVTKSITGTLSFCLRHAVAFYGLGLLTGLPTYLHRFLPREHLPELPQFPELRGLELPRPWWEAGVAIPVIETMLLGVATAIMVQTLRRDRRGEDWTVFPGIAAALPRLPTVLAVCLVYSVATVLFGGVAIFIGESSPVAIVLLLVLFVLVAFLAMVYAVAVPCAAVDNAGIYYCFERSAELTSGSRWLIFAAMMLSALPVVGGVVIFLLVLGHDFSAGSIPALWTWLLGALGGAYFMALSVILREALVVLKEGSGARDTAEVFD